MSTISDRINNNNQPIIEDKELKFEDSNPLDITSKAVLPGGKEEEKDAAQIALGEPELRSWYDDRLKDINEKFDTKEKAVQKREMIQTLTNAITQFGAAMAGQKAGVDLSNLNLAKQDFDKKLDRLSARRESQESGLRQELGARRRYQELLEGRSARKEEKAEERQFIEKRDVAQATAKEAAETAKIEASKQIAKDKTEIEKVGKNREESAKLAKEFESHPVIKNTNLILEQHGKIKVAGEESEKLKTGAGDLALVFAYMKMLDPGSVVRESEFKAAANVAGIPDQIQNVRARLLEGKVLTPQQRKEFIELSNDMATTQVAQYNRIRDRFVDRSKRFGLDPELATGKAIESTEKVSSGPKPGDEVEGYRFMGGDPSKQENWEKI